MLAITTISGKQYKVHKGDIVDVDHLNGAVGDSLIFKGDFAYDADSKTVEKANSQKIIKVKILKQFLGKKVEVRRFKSKVRYRKQNGFRSARTKVEILSIE